MLTGVERDLVYEHAVRHFPKLVVTSAGGFDELPFLDRERARPWYGREVDGARSFTSTGTSGQPKPVPWTAREDDWYVGEKRTVFRSWLGRYRRVFISLAVGHNADSAGRVFAEPGVEVHQAGLDRVVDQCATITALRPEVLCCSPSILDHLIGEFRRLGQRPGSVRRVITNGEVLFPAAKAQVVDFFGLQPWNVMDTYGSTEVGTIAYSCPDCGSYHFFDGIYPERVPERALVPDPGSTGSAAAPGAAVLAVSSLKRTSFPVIRFVTHDMVTGLDRTRCGGRQRFTVEAILGRCDDLLNYGELFSPYQLADLIRLRLPGARWFAFNPGNDLTVVIEGAEPAGFSAELRSRYPLHSQLADLGLINPPELWFIQDFDDFLARAGLPTPRTGKDVRRVLRIAADRSWFARPAT